MNHPFLRYSLLFLLYCFSLPATAQEPDTKENILQQLSRARQDSTRCRLLQEYISESRNPDTMLAYNKRLEELAQRLLDREPEAKARQLYQEHLSFVYDVYGYYYSSAGKEDTAIIFHRKSLKLSEELKDSSGIAATTANIAFSYESLGNLPLALEGYYKALRLYEKLEKKESIALILGNIGQVYMQQQLYHKALTNYRKGLALLQHTDNWEGIAAAYNSIGGAYAEQHKEREALHYYRQALKQLEGKDHPYAASAIANNIGEIYISYWEQELKKPQPDTDSIRYFSEQGLHYLAEARQQSQQINYAYGLAVALKNMAAIHFLHKQYRDAIGLGEQSLTAAKASGNPKAIALSAEALATYYKQTGNYKEALDKSELAALMQDSLTNQENRKRSLQKGYEYEYEKKESLLKQKAAARRAKERMIYIGVIAALVLCIAIALVWSYFYRQKKHTEKKLREKEMIVAAAISERKRIAADLHDDLGSGIAGVKTMVGLLRHKEGNTPARNTGLQQLWETVTAVSSRLNETVWELNQEHDNLEDLLLYIQKQGKLLLNNEQMSFSMILPLELPQLMVPGSVRRQIFLVVKEAFHNILKHAGATEARCTAGFGKALELEITDNGRGFDTSSKQVGEGLENMKNRIESLRGTLIFHSGDKGTSVRISIPLDFNNPEE